MTDEKKPERTTTPPTNETTDNGCRCQSCGQYYRVDINVPDDLWDRIRPGGKAEGAGMLCGRCIMNRVEALGEFGALRVRGELVDMGRTTTTPPTEPGR